MATEIFPCVPARFTFLTCVPNTFLKITEPVVFSGKLYDNDVLALAGFGYALESSAFLANASIPTGKAA